MYLAQGRLKTMRVLLAVEDSQFGQAIIDYVASHSWKPGTMFKLLHVVEPTLVGDSITAIYGVGLDNQILEERTKSGSELMENLRHKLQAEVGAALPVEVSVQIGQPQHVILEEANHWKANTIIMGSHGRRGLSRFFLGSVSLAVLAQSKCTVTVVRVDSAD